MKLKTILAMSVMALCSAACSDDGEMPVLTDMTGSYDGYTLASCAYFQDRCTDNETLEITDNGDGTFAVVFESAAWGTFRVAGAAVARSGDGYAFAGEGTVSMGMGENASDYAFTMTGTSDAAKSSYSFAFNVPAVMGGLTVTLLSGTAPDTVE